MSFKPHQFNVPTQQENEILTYNNFEGLNLADTPTQIRPNESADMLNMVLDDEGALDSRFGFSSLPSISLGNTKINGMFIYGTQFLVSQGGYLYVYSTSQI